MFFKYPYYQKHFQFNVIAIRSSVAFFIELFFFKLSEYLLYKITESQNYYVDFEQTWVTLLQQGYRMSLQHDRNEGLTWTFNIPYEPFHYRKNSSLQWTLTEEVMMSFSVPFCFFQNKWVTIWDLKTKPLSQGGPLTLGAKATLIFIGLSFRRLVALSCHIAFMRNILFYLSMFPNS